MKCSFASGPKIFEGCRKLLRKRVLCVQPALGVVSRRVEGAPPSPSTGFWKEAGNKQPALNPNSKQLFAAGSGIGCEAVPAKRAVHGSCGAGLVSSRPSKLGVVQQLYFTMSMGLQPSLCITGIPPLAPSISTATSSKNPE